MSAKYIISENYQPVLDAMETEKAIKLIKDFFQMNLAEALNLRRVTAPLFVRSGTGINDDLNGVERPISFKIKNIRDNALIGGILAVFFILVFLRNWRPTATIALAIPLSVICTFIAIYAAGYTINLLTLGGLALGIGMLVDDAIVVIENIFRHMEGGAGGLRNRLRKALPKWGWPSQHRL